MNSRQLLEDLKTLKAYKDERVRLGTLAIENNLLPQLISYCKDESAVSHQACWSLEQSFLIYEDHCYPHLVEISKLYLEPLNSSGMRPLTNIASIILKRYYSKRNHVIKEFITEEIRENMLEGCFRSLIEDVGKTANMAYATRALFELGKEYDWVHPELVIAIEQAIQRDPTSGYRACGKETLKKIALIND
jgi:hypothetical protein